MHNKIYGNTKSKKPIASTNGILYKYSKLLFPEGKLKIINRNLG